MSPDAVIANDAPVALLDHGVVTVKKTTTIPLNTDEKTTILLNVESTIKEIVNKIAKREDIEGFSINAEDYPEVPNSLTGVMVHYLVEGLKRDFSVEFDIAPKSLRIRGGGDKYDKKIKTYLKKIINQTTLQKFDSLSHQLRRSRTGTLDYLITHYEWFQNNRSEVVR